MSHKPYIRHIPGSRHAVLLIHGILGTPDHFAPLLPLIPADHSIYNLLLDGHGGTVKEFSRSSMEKWKTQVRSVLSRLRREHAHILIAAHSMGTLFALQESVRDSSGIEGLFLLQVPLYPRLRLSTACRSVLLPFGIVPKGAEQMCGDCSVTLNPRLWQYLGWIPRFLELFAECRRTRGILDKVCVPCQAFQSQNDELVSNRSAKCLQQYTHIVTTILPDSGHFGHTGSDLALLCSRFRALFGQ